MGNCHLYIKDKCIAKLLIDNQSICDHDCKDNLSECTFKKFYSTLQEKTDLDVRDDSIAIDPIYKYKCTVSVHLQDNPYKVKADILFYPVDITLTIDDHVLLRMSRNTLQSICDNVPKPIKMGTVYEVGNGGANSHIKSQKIHLATVAGNSRLVNEKDIKSSVRKSLAIADQSGAKTICMIPCDCATHDIDLTAFAQLSAIAAYLQSHADSQLEHIFIVMQDDQSLQAYEKYCRKIFTWNS